MHSAELCAAPRLSIDSGNLLAQDFHPAEHLLGLAADGVQVGIRKHHVRRPEPSGAELHIPNAVKDLLRSDIEYTALQQKTPLCKRCEAMQAVWKDAAKRHMPGYVGNINSQGSIHLDRVEQNYILGLLEQN